MALASALVVTGDEREGLQRANAAREGDAG
jgi:hypothetical protein